MFYYIAVNMKKTLWAIIIIVIIVVLGGILFTKNSSNLQTDKTAIKVGVIIPLTGDLAIIGEELKKGIDLAISELQFKGLNITAIYEDDRFDPKVTATAANKLLNIDKVNFAVTFSIEEARPIVSIFNDHKVPLVVTWDSNI
ncbi:MAG: ABC transporter substrate-binding protein, partial [Patescibacteria group bacterium]